MRIANYVMLTVFLLSAAVQYNDPDPFVWMFYYLTASVFTILALAGRYTWLAGVAALAYLAGFALYIPGWNIDTVLLLKEPKMHNIEVELAREAFGLLICAVWMSVLTFQWLHRNKQAKEADRDENGAARAE